MCISPVHGVIFLFKYPVGETRATPDAPLDGTYDHAAAERLFFANQVIANACGTQALLSVLLNHDGAVDIGAQLREFKEFTGGFPPEVRRVCFSLSIASSVSTVSFLR